MVEFHTCDNRVVTFGKWKYGKSYLRSKKVRFVLSHLPLCRLSQCLHYVPCNFSTSNKIALKNIFSILIVIKTCYYHTRNMIIIIFFTNTIFHKFHKWLLNDLSHLLMNFIEYGELLRNALSMMVPSFGSKIWTISFYILSDLVSLARLEWEKYEYMFYCLCVSSQNHLYCRFRPYRLCPRIWWIFGTTESTDISRSVMPYAP